jgi:steroid 5-alpha reductase family enzyme
MFFLDSLFQSIASDLSNPDEIENKKDRLLVNTPEQHFSKSVSLLICAGVYAAALIAALLTGFLLSGHHMILVAFAADVMATIVVFIFSIMFNNSSMYDAYWSAAPPLVAFYFLFCGGAEIITIRNMLVIILVSAWSFRLTYNWARQWRGLVHEDWRYADIRNKTGRAYWVVSFLGIHLFPTVQVFLACISLYPALAGEGGSSLPLNITAGLVTASAIWIEARADRELDRFKKSPKKPGQVLSTGIWAWSRHPNYFGEILFWWGIFLFAVSSKSFQWWCVIGPLFITLMFILISIPMMEKHMLARKPAFREYMKKTPMLVPWFPGR